MARPPLCPCFTRVFFLSVFACNQAFKLAVKSPGGVPAERDVLTTMYFAYFSNATQKGTQRAVTTTIFFLVPLQLHIPSMILPCFFSQAWQFCNASSCAAADSQRLEGAPGISWRLGTGVAGCDSRDSAQGTFSSRFASLGFFGDSAAALLVSWKHVETYRYMEAGGHFQTQVLQFRITVKKGC